MLKQGVIDPVVGISMFIVLRIDSIMAKGTQTRIFLSIISSKL